MGVLHSMMTHLLVLYHYETITWGHRLPQASMNLSASIGYPERVRREAVERRRQGKRQAVWRGLRIVLLLMALGAMLYWFWWQPMHAPPPPLRIEFRP
jgi:hypothetical protein